MFPLILTVLAIFLFALNWLQFKNKWELLKNLPGPKPLPIIGSAHLCGNNPYELLNYIFNLWKECKKDIFCLYLGQEPNVVITNPKDVEAVLSSTALIRKSPIYNILHPWLGQGLLTSSGKRWFTHRKMITPTFHFKILVDFLDAMNVNSEKFIDLLREKTVKSEIFDVQRMIQFLTLDTICDTAMGVNIKAMENPDSEVVKAFEEVCRISQIRAFMISRKFDITFRFTSDYKIYKKALKVLTEFTADVIAKRRETLRNIDEANKQFKNEDSDDSITIKKVFLDTLLTAEVDNQPLSFQSIYEEVSTFMFEGHDTTASGLAFTTFLLSRHPSVQQKVFEEQKFIFGDDMKRQPTYNDIQNMSYLEIVLKECMRMYPSVPIIGRSPTEEFNMNGRILPKDTSVMIFILAMGYDEKIFPDPYKFDPERFSVENLSKRTNAYEYVPFSAGPRNCVGQKFAMLEMKSVISKVVRNYEILPAKDELISKDGYQIWEQDECDPRLSSVLTLKSDNGILIRLRARHF